MHTFAHRLDRYLTSSDEPLGEDNRMDEFTKESLEFASDFNVDKYGLITNPGKFERECQWLPYYYNMALLGAQDEVMCEYYEDGDEVMYSYDIFHLGPRDWELWPDLIDVRCIAIWEDIYGFIYAELDPDLSLLED